MNVELTEEEFAALRRIEARLEMDLDGVNSRHGATIALLEEELTVVRKLLAEAEG